MAARLARESVSVRAHARLGAPRRVRARPMTRVVVTGASGFVGGHVVAELARRGIETVALGRRGASLAPVEGVCLQRVDVWDRSSLARVLAAADCVVHAASVVHRPGASADEYHRFNIDGTQALVDACDEVGVAKILMLGTIKVYGENTAGSVLDEACAVVPEGHYAASKLRAETIVSSRPGSIVFRLSPVFGRGDKGNVRAMIRAIARRRFVVPGDGSARKSLVHVSSVAAAVAAATTSSVSGAYVLADPIAPTMRELADTIARALGHRPPPSIPVPVVLAGAWLLDLLSSVSTGQARDHANLVRKAMTSTLCSPAQIQRALGIDCHVELSAAILDEVQWMRSQSLL